MADILGILTGTLDQSTKKVSKDQFKAKLVAEKDKLAGSNNPTEKEQAEVISDLLQGDIFVKLDINNDGFIDEAEISAGANLDGKAGYTKDDTAKLRGLASQKGQPPAKGKGKLSPPPPSTQEAKDVPPPVLERYMREKLRSEGGYLTGIARDPNGISRTLYAGKFEVDDPENGLNTFQMFFGKDNKLHVIQYGGEGLDRDTPVREYIIPIDTLEDAAFENDPSYLLKVQGRDNYSGSSYSKGKAEIVFGADRKDSSAFVDFIKQFFIKDGKIDLTKLQGLKGVVCREGENMTKLTTAPEKYITPKK